MNIEFLIKNFMYSLKVFLKQDPQANINSKTERQHPLPQHFHYACFYSFYVRDRTTKVPTVLQVTSFSLLVYHVYILEIKILQPKN